MFTLYVLAVCHVCGQGRRILDSGGDSGGDGGVGGVSQVRRVRVVGPIAALCF